MSACLSVTQHDQGGHQVEGRHGDDQGQDQEHHLLLHGDGLEEIAVALHPVRYSIGLAELSGKLACHRPRAKHVIQAQADAAWTIQPIQGLRILHVHDSKGTVVLLHADFENSAHGETLETRLHAHRRRAHLRRDQGGMVAHADSKLHGQFATEDDVEAAGTEVIQLADHHLAVDFRNMRLVFGQDASHDGAGHALALQHGFAFDIGRRTKHMRIALGTRKRLRPVAHALIHAFHGGVGNHAEDAVLQLAIKSRSSPK
jgi:hypothetical protein